MHFKINTFIQTIYLLGFFILCSCSASKNSLNVVLSAKKLRSDVDFTYRKLQKLHPNLYGYISKKELDQKFDSLKASIQGPMTANEFYFRLSPVIASVKQGHTRLYRDAKKNVTDRFNYEILNNKLYIIKDQRNDTIIKPGTEIVSVNDINPDEIINKYRNVFTSDGFNQTFINRILCKTFENTVRFENAEKLNIIYKIRYHDSVRFINLDETAGHPTKEKKRSSAFFTDADLTFPVRDSSVALMKINSFSGYMTSFYRRSFDKIHAANTDVLILDLRDNLGGTIRNVSTLYSYLVDTSFCFLDESEVTSRTSLLHTRNFRNASLIGKTFLLAFIPLRWTYKAFQISNVTKGTDGRYYYSLPESKPEDSNPNNFKGKVYVIINGGSFSATCLLSSDLKGKKRAVFVGEETGGAFNGTVAGVQPIFRLPNSGLKINIGLMLIQPHYRMNIPGRGIFPDVEIHPGLQDRLTGNDPELQWILKDIEKHKKPVNNKGTTITCL